MKLSTAIREGSKRRPQVSEDFFNPIREYHAEDDAFAPVVPCVFGSCALGAAAEALFGRTYSASELPKIDAEFELKSSEFGRTLYQTHGFSCPVCGTPQFDRLEDIIPHLNDGHEWTREAIADWLEGIGL